MLAAASVARRCLQAAVWGLLLLLLSLLLTAPAMLLQVRARAAPAARGVCNRLHHRAHRAAGDQ